MASCASRGGVFSLVPRTPPIVNFVSRLAHDLSPFSIPRLFPLSLLNNALIGHSVTKGIRSAEIVSRANASVWATTLYFGPRPLLPRPFSQLRTLLRRWSSIPKALRHRRLLLIPLRLLDTCLLPRSHLRRPSSRNHPVPPPTNPSTELLLIPLLELTHKALQTCKTPLTHGLMAWSPHTKVRIGPSAFTWSSMRAFARRTTGTDISLPTAKNLHVNDLLSLRGIDPPPPHPIGNLPPGRLEEIQAVFLATYAPAIDKLLEVRWYSEKALPTLMADSQLMADYSALIDAYNQWNYNDGNVLARLESFEASVIWRSMVLCRQVPGAENGQYGQDWNLLAANARLSAIETLLSWNHLERNELSRELGMDAATPPSPPDQFMQRQLDFWSELGEFLTLHDNEASSAKQMDDTLGRCRQLLDTYENRDIIYSIAITRHLGQRWADFPNSLPKVGSTNEKEAGTKLFVAQKFLEEEAEGKGTTQVYKRICCMAVRSWWVARE